MILNVVQVLFGKMTSLAGSAKMTCSGETLIEPNDAH